MKKIITGIALLISIVVSGQLIGLDVLNMGSMTTAEMNAIPANKIKVGSYVDNLTTKTLWRYDGTIWEDTATGGTTYTAGAGLTLSGSEFSVTNPYNLLSNSNNSITVTSSTPWILGRSNSSNISGLALYGSAFSLYSANSGQSWAFKNGDGNGLEVVLSGVANKTYRFNGSYSNPESVPTKSDIDAAIAAIPSGGTATPTNLTLSGNQILNDNGTGVDLTPLLGSGTTPAPENPNPELLLDYGAVSYPPHETLRTEYKGWTNLNDPTVTPIYENTNGVGQIVEEVEGTGVGFYRRIRLETVLNETYDIEVLMRVLEGTGQITTLGGTSPVLNIQVPNGTEWVKYNFQLTDNNAFDGIILALRGYLGTGKFQYKVSQKLAN